MVDLTLVCAAVNRFHRPIFLTLERVGQPAGFKPGEIAGFQKWD